MPKTVESISLHLSDVQLTFGGVGIKLIRCQLIRASGIRRSYDYNRMKYFNKNRNFYSAVV